MRQRHDFDPVPHSSGEICQVCGEYRVICVRQNSKNNDILSDFTYYCHTHPQERFWQALLNWSGFMYIYGSHAFYSKGAPYLEDTFHREGK